MADDEWVELTTELRQLEDRPGTGEHESIDRDRALLIMLVGSEANRTFTIAEETVIGRSPDATIQIIDDDISRRHACITRTGPGRFTIEDLGSKNGTLVNGVPVKMQLLRFGDKIRLGSRTMLIFSEYDRVEDQLLQAQRLESIGRLAGGVAHDFNNILGAVLANVGFLKGLSRQASFGDAEVRESLDDIDTAVRRAVELTKQLLGLARQEPKGLRQIDFSGLMGEVIKLVARTFDRAIAVETEVTPGLVVQGEPSQLHQMLMNLCINARDAMPAGGGLNLVARRTRLERPDMLRLPFLRPGLYVEVVVRDNGIGMDELVRRRIFEPFFTTKEDGVGTGLGLATVYNIVKQHGGHIDVDSKVGQGTSFRVYLPALERRANSTEELEIFDAAASSAGEGTVLLVDDEEVFLKSARRLLEGLGYTVLTACDGVEAVQLFERERHRIQLVLLDMIMPQLNGAGTFDALRRLDPGVRVVVSSGQTQVGGVRELLAAGARGYLQKPYDVKMLGEALARALVNDG